MFKFKKHLKNPFLVPNKENSWEADAAFNPCVIKRNDKYHLVYRALSNECMHHDQNMRVSTVGYSSSLNGVDFGKHSQLIKPEHDWEKYGCEDPRVTFFNEKYYIFYTALSKYPFCAQGIKVGVAITKDFKNIEEKHPVTTFNSKAMALFPEKINGKIAAILTANTDLPPSKICIAFFDEIEQIWSEQYWEHWYSELDLHVLALLRSAEDHLEVGAPPIKTEKGWLLVYSYIQNYFSDDKIFGIEAVLLDINDPFKLIGRTAHPILVPEEEYELKGDVPNVIFPSGSLLEGDNLTIYYGATDTTCCCGQVDINKLLMQMIPTTDDIFAARGFKRFKQNPILSPRPEFNWEAKAVFNPAAIYEDGRVHLVYRAMSFNDTSVFGYACSTDGVHIDKRLPRPIYYPRENFEKSIKPGHSGCEDPRITKMEGRFYIFYTAYDGFSPRVAFSSIKVSDFLENNWIWDKPKVITPPGIPNKDACLLSKKVKGKYVIFHRPHEQIYINYVDDLKFSDGFLLEQDGILIDLRKEFPLNNPLDAVTFQKESVIPHKFGISAPPLETKYGWLLFFHYICTQRSIYKVGAALLDLEDPSNILEFSDRIYLQPEMDYERRGVVPNVVFPCGATIIDEEVYLYYGGADKIVAVAKMGLHQIFKKGFGIKY